MAGAVGAVVAGTVVVAAAVVAAAVVGGAVDARVGVVAVVALLSLPQPAAVSTAAKPTAPKIVRFERIGTR